MRNPYRLMPNAYRSRSGGQALILILLVMSVSLLIGVGVSFRATSTLRQISFSEQSIKAYSFAEAGAEDALKCLKEKTCGPGYSRSLNVDGEGENDVSYSIKAFGNERVVDEFSPLERGENIEIKMDPYPSGAYIQLHWVDTGNPSESNPEDHAALVVHLVYLEGGVYKLKSYAFDPYGIRRQSNKFNWGSGWGDPNERCTSPGGSPDTISYQYHCRLKMPSGAIALRITPLYNDDVPNTFAIYAPPKLPSQGAVIVSSGWSGQAKRTVEVTRTDPVLPGIFDFVYFSGSSL